MEEAWTLEVILAINLKIVKKHLQYQPKTDSR